MARQILSDGRIIDLTLIRNPKLKRVFNDRVRDFMFNHSEHTEGTHRDGPFEHSDCGRKDHMDNSRPSHSDHTYSEKATHTDYTRSCPDHTDFTKHAHLDLAPRHVDQPTHVDYKEYHDHSDYNDYSVEGGD